ncbi:MAG: heme exporter protein CcmD [Sphingomonadaceae bacterium]|jgi:heme exporter protein CcmD|nr:heme exporter protein CcmD [Sphingomonadaceae bacterium]MCB2086215.1 heme exporter protein CcmD [Sphingomonadaceae bacterium]MCP5384484.1 heme exporter protein CcmD [Altererythrobacter sp.]MCP5391040.1 heme exporter protein CcmD [Sphingomonadaceae bacterium]MCP5393986.1 heme exporter protein CcmD [Sphingomonadaceae bacterium]
MRENLDQWNYVIAAYAIALVAIAAIVAWSWYDMRRAERRREEAKRK